MAKQQNSQAEPTPTARKAATVPAKRSRTAPRRATGLATRKTVSAERKGDGTVAVPQAPAPDGASEREEIALLAYTYWEARGCPAGSGEDDWFRAEQTLRLQREAGS